MANSKISALTSATTPLAGTEVLPIVQSSTTKQVSVANLTAGRAVAALSLSTTSGFTFRGADNTLYEILRYIGSAGKNPGLFGKVVDSTTSAYFGSASSSGADILYLGTSSTSQQTLKFDTAGDTTFLTGNVIQGTAAKGINFTANTPAAGKTSQLLNWYEEGTFTPTVIGTTTAGTASYSAQAGAYTRIGRVVHFQIYLVWSGGTGSGDLRIAGLPFTSGTGNNGYGCAVAMFNLNLGLTANNYTVGGFVLANDTAIRLMQNVVGGGTASNVAYDASAEIMVSGSYFV